MTTGSSFHLHRDDGQDIFVRRWLPQGTAKAAMVLAHGAAEHSARYDRFAQALNRAGYAVYAPDHRGHGETADTYGWAGDDGWNAMLADFKALTEHVATEQAGTPLVLMGHSMGSIIAQQALQGWGTMYKAAVLSGTFGVIEGMEQLVPMTEAAAADDNAGGPSAIFGHMFAGFNEPFQPGTTGFEWLSRDTAEVQKYVDDPACGFPFSNRLVADFMRGMQDAWTPANEARIPTDVPVLMVSGAMDPAGGNTASVNALADRYRALGVRDLEVKFYPEARHEILNELNRHDVEQDIIAWLDKHISG